jgi:hypothetical protein
MERKSTETRIGGAPMVATRIPRGRYGELKSAAAEAGLPISTWIRCLVFKELAAQKRRQK